MIGEIHSTTIHVDDALLDDLRARLALTRYPNQLPGIGFDQGMELSLHRRIIDYWRHHYDWRRHERQLNRHANFMTEVDGQRLHFVHERSTHAHAVPLLLLHGWPSTPGEFVKIIHPLTQPDAHGGDAADAFHVIAPSLPGYGFSGPTVQAGWTPRRIASAFLELMSVLGYERFALQGGDFGSVVAVNVADLAPERLIGLHMNYTPEMRGRAAIETMTPPRGFDLESLTATERHWLEVDAAWRTQNYGYHEIQATQPQTLGYAIEDSPSGVAAWFIEKFREVCDGELLEVFTIDELLDNVTAFWITATVTSSCRLYYEARQAGTDSLPRSRIEVPTGIAVFPADACHTPRAWVQKRYNVTWWTDQPRGGHFAALDAPDLLVGDIRGFFATVR